MSEFFFRRLMESIPLLFRSLTVEEKKEVDDEFEKVTGKECDEATKAMSSAEFYAAANEAVRRVRMRKKQKRGEDEGQKLMMAVA